LHKFRPTCAVERNWTRISPAPTAARSLPARV